MTELSLVTWNLNGLDDLALDERTEAALFTALLGGDPESVVQAGGPPPPPPDVLCFQEVVERTLHAHLLPHLRAAGYQVLPAEPPPDRAYFEVVAARGVQRAESLPFARSGQGRRLTRVLLGSGLTVLTAHLESLGPGRPVRLEQAALVLDLLRASGPAVFAGDTNLRDTEWERLDPTGIADAWEAAGRAPATRATWGAARYDRVWLAGGLAVRRFTRFGGTALPTTGRPPSDHLALRVELGWPQGAPVRAAAPPGAPTT